MRQLSMYFGMLMRIFFTLFLISWTGFMIRFFIFEFLKMGNYELVVFPGLILTVGLAGGFYYLKNQCNVLLDDEYIYVENLLVREKIPLRNIKTYYINFKGFNIVFRERTKFGGSIFFRQKYFQKKQTIAILNEILKENQSMNAETVNRNENSHIADNGNRLRIM